MRKIPPWAMFTGLFMIPAGTYAWMLYTRPNVYEQIADEIRRQEEAERIRQAAEASQTISSGCGSGNAIPARMQQRVEPNANLSSVNVLWSTD
eukprot:CAMPEP_0202864330 /NCGR_PEP_ID=MMETSP1391-20130828/4614_1 /ASSEMBLY_ACC=CAM_ASM_000867 /TAXON_ID=1034604 /ORGANISM="Chlamydomonas leiostraca, Strain SAG 11-49" /LENGTH=92 /DNA_ID=CAMNT_0049544065 /DNA_START=117 /DNA_END=394 /DNA_ORIENTATION=+